MNIALIQQDVVKADKVVNFKTVRRIIGNAMEGQTRPDLIVLPELWSTGYALEELASLASENGDEEADYLSEIAREYGVWLAGGSVVAKIGGSIANRAQVISPEGELQTWYDKVHLVPMFNEDRYMVSGKKSCIHEIKGVKIGFAICYDLRFGTFLHNLCLSGAMVLIICAQWPMKRINHWQILLQARAIENQCFVIGVNAAGVRDGHGGNSMAVSPDGRIMAQSGLEETFSTVSLDLEEISKVRDAVPVFAGRKPELYHNH